MRIEGDTLHAKTSVGFFTDEMRGVKPFTVRMVSEKEWDEIRTAWATGGITHICISATYSGESFRRRITRIWKLGELVGFVQMAVGWAGNREGSAFRCRQCGFQLHADLNASRNIAQAGISCLSRLPCQPA